MLDVLLLSLRLRIAYRVNGILYGLKCLWGIRRLLPQSVYRSHGLKTFALILALLLEILFLFPGKILYFALFFLLPARAMELQDAAAMLWHPLLFLTVIGAMLNNPLFEPGQDKYYAIVLMRMDARSYILTNYGYELLKLVVGLVPVVMLYGCFVAGVPIWQCLLVPVFVAAVKLTAAGLTVRGWGKRGIQPSPWAKPLPRLIMILVLLAAAYVPLLLGHALPTWVFYGALILACLTACLGIRTVLRFDGYRRISRLLLMESSSQKLEQGKIMQDNLQKKLEVDVGDSSKSGCAYLHDLFVRRHRRLLTQAAVRLTWVMVAGSAILAAVTLFIPQAAGNINGAVGSSAILFLMYLINRGRNYTAAMFFNCDHSMLSYRFFRQGATVLQLFTARLKTLSVINLLPAAVIAVAQPVLLYLSGGTNQPILYFLLPLATLAISVFFSVHTMVLYYLLQPYNIGMESRSLAYGIANGVTYFVCYFSMNLKLPAIVFCLWSVVFCLIYIPVALVLAYRLAPKTFRLRA